MINIYSNDELIGNVDYDSKKDYFILNIKHYIYEKILHNKGSNIFKKLPDFLRLEDNSFSRKQFIKNHNCDLMNNEFDWKVLNYFAKEFGTFNQLTFK